MNRHAGVVACFRDGSRQTPVTRYSDLKIYMSIVFRISPTASPSISKGSPGSTMMV